MSTDTTPAPTTTITTPRNPGTRMNVRRRAAAAARIFDVVATVVVVFGGLFVLGLIVTGLTILAASAGSESVYSPVLIVAGMVVGTVVTAIVTALNWAAITLATAVAGYVAQQTPQA